MPRINIWNVGLSIFQDSRRNSTIILYTFIASKHKADSFTTNVESGAKVGKCSVTCLLALVEHEAYCRFQVSRLHFWVIQANTIRWHSASSYDSWASSGTRCSSLCSAYGADAPSETCYDALHWAPVHVLLVHSLITSCKGVSQHI